MVYFSQAALAACIASLVHASPLLNHRAADFGPLAALENITAIPRGWAPAGAPSSSTTMTMQIALKQNNIAGLQAKLMDISDPDSPNYAKWLSQEEMETYTSPSTETVNAVKLWLASFGISDSAITQPTPDFMEIKMPLTQGELMLNTKYSLYHDSISGRTVPRTLSYSIPLLLHDHIDMIQPTTAFHRPMGPQVAHNLTASSGHTKRATCDPNNIVPACILSYYNVDYTSKGKASLAVTGLIGLDASHTDATTFLNDYYTKAKGAKFTDGSISSGSNDPSNPSLEGNLDTQLALSLGYPNPVTFYEVGPEGNSGNDFSDELVNLGNFLNSAKSPPSAISTSYGGEEQGFSSNYLTSICNGFMKAGSRGVSIFFSSGDYGVGGNGEDDCEDDGSFYALFPASCPYITSVGATQFANGGEQTAQFQNGGGSGGGFSFYFSTPSYQTSQVNSYVNYLGNYYSGYYNPNGRGYPDVALVGEYYDIILNGGSEQVYGTSASSPSWASLISLINDYRISEGKASLGFLNPALYKLTSGLVDITSGYNYGCDTDGFPASKGWDAATGLGSMNFAALRKALG